MLTVENFSTTSARVGMAMATGVAIFLGALPHQAAADIFLMSPDISGESKDTRYRGGVDLLSYTQSYRRPPFDYNTGGGSTGKATCGEVTVLKNIDKSSPALLAAVAIGRHMSQVDIIFRSAGASQLDYYKVQMFQVLVIGVDQTDQPDPSRIVEKVQFSAMRYKYTYTPLTPQGAPGTPIEFGYDCARQSPF